MTPKLPPYVPRPPESVASFMAGLELAAGSTSRCELRIEELTGFVIERRKREAEERRAGK